MKTFISGVNASLKVGWQEAAQLLTWEIKIDENGSLNNWILNAKIKSTDDFWFENQNEFTLVTSIGVFEHVIKKECVGLGLIMEGHGGPIK